MATKLFGAVFVAGLLSRGALAQDDKPEAEFTFPDKEGYKFYEKDAITVSYKSNWSSVSLWTFCSENGEVIQKDLIEEAASGDGSEEVQINFQTSADDCWFNIRNNDDENSLGINSDHFVISRNERSQTTIGLAQESTTSEPATQSTPASKSSSSQETKPTNDKSTQSVDSKASEEKDDGLSTGAKAGIGVGVALGVVGLAALAGVFFILRRRKARANEPGNADERQELQGGGVGEPKRHDWDQSPPQELPVQTEADKMSRVHEMPG